MIGIPNRRSHKPMCEIFQFTLPYNSPNGTAISFSETIPLIRRMIGKGNDLRQLNSQLKRRPPVGGGGGCAQSESVRQWQSGVIRWRRATQSGIMRQQGRTPPSMYQLVLWQSCILSYYCTLYLVAMQHGSEYLAMCTLIVPFCLLYSPHCNAPYTVTSY